jgi:DNA repair exonuclease SbcCD ATPase subunit
MHPHAYMMLRGSQPTMSPPDDTGGGDDAAAKAAAEKAAAEKAAAEAKAAEEAAAAKAAEEEAARKAAEEEAARNANTDEEKAKLLKDVMKWKEKAREQEALAKKYEGIDPEKARAALEAQAAAERKELEAKGEYQRIIAQVAEEADAKVKAAEAKVAEVQNQLTALQESIQKADVASKFANSTFVRENLIISGAKVQTLYGDHFDVVEGEIVAYDKPRGAKDRTPLVDASGKNLSFEAAVEKVVKSDSEWERLTKSGLKKGPGSTSSNLDPNARETPTNSKDLIAKGLSSLKPRASILGR